NGTDLLFDYIQRFRELVQGIRPQHVLVLGGGAFTLPTALVQEFPKMRVDVVELDGELIGIARDYFDFKPNEYTGIHIGDARQFLDDITNTYDVIVLDVFEHAAIPASFQTTSCMQSLRKCLNKDGVVAVNVIASLNGRRSAVLYRMQELLRSSFQNVDVFPSSQGQTPWALQNFIMTAQNGTRDMAAHLRYPPIDASKY
ncbi:MAG TPA: fused MFS/spermidine synthase, partial [Candidatus Saccharimonadales bacterium]|nr:fused MFS/spermidine synthase [Candidatus Saccharimonadales bacterium]